MKVVLSVLLFFVIGFAVDQCLKLASAPTDFFFVGWIGIAVAVIVSSWLFSVIWKKSKKKES